MTWQQFLDSSIEQALVGLDADNAGLSNQDGEVETLAQSVLADFAYRMVNDPEHFYLLQRNYLVDLNPTLFNGQILSYGVLDDEIIPVSLTVGTVADVDGNILQPVQFFNDLLRPRNPMYGYYLLQDKRVYTKQFQTGDLATTVGPLSVKANFLPTSTTLETDITHPGLLNMLTTALAEKIRGQIPEIR